MQCGLGKLLWMLQITNILQKIIYHPAICKCTMYNAMHVYIAFNILIWKLIPRAYWAAIGGELIPKFVFVTHSCMHAGTRTHTHTHTHIHTHTHTHTHTYTHTLIHSLTHSLTRSSTHSLSAQGSCPTPESGSSGTCVFACTDDSACPGSQLCCSNGCGHVCLDPVYTNVTVTCTGPNGRTYRPGETYTAADGCNTW